MRCPGQDMQYWKPGAIFEANCPHCGQTVEFFKDDTARTCGKCGHRFVNPQMDFGCAAYCPYAEQCLGTLPEGLAAQKENLLKDRVAVEMKRYFKNDFKRIGHASRVARHAERIGKAVQGNLAVILSAAYLHDIGGGEAGRQDDSPPPSIRRWKARPWRGRSGKARRPGGADRRRLRDYRPPSPSPPRRHSSTCRWCVTRIS